MKRHFSRRAFLTGIGGGAASAVVIWELSELTFRPGRPSKENPVVAGCCPYTDYDGWLVTIPDKRILSFPVRYVEGWFPEEKSQETTWRWSHQTATLLVPNPGVDAILYVDYDGRADLFQDRPRTISVSVRDQVLQAFLADASGRHSRRIPLPASALGDSDTAEIRIAVDRTFVPADRLAGSRDDRELGVVVFEVDVHLAPGAMH